MTSDKQNPASFIGLLIKNPVILLFSVLLLFIPLKNPFERTDICDLFEEGFVLSTHVWAQTLDVFLQYDTIRTQCDYWYYRYSNTNINKILWNHGLSYTKANQSTVRPLLTKTDLLFHILSYNILANGSNLWVQYNCYYWADILTSSTLIINHDLVSQTILLAF